jgi:NTE family protein
MVKSKRKNADGQIKVAIGCQGGGMHAAFAVGVLTKILRDLKERKGAGDETGFKLVGLSGTSAGALCALMVWYGLAPKKKKFGGGSEQEAIDKLNSFWDGFVAKEAAETALNFLTYRTFWLEELEIPRIGVNAPTFGRPNPYGGLFKAVIDCLPSLGVRKQYFDLEKLLAEACPALDNNSIDWEHVTTRLLIGASEVVNGFETVFDSHVKKNPSKLENEGMNPPEKLKGKDRYWRQRLPLSLSGIAASGTLPSMREAEKIGPFHYWDGLYAHNPPVREFITDTEEVPDELWIVRINPQQWPYVPIKNKDVQDRQNELMGNLSLNKELDFIMSVNEWQHRYKDERFGEDHKPVVVRTIKMAEDVARDLSYSSKFDRSPDRMNDLRNHGEKIAENWLDKWHEDKAGSYPEDAGYYKREGVKQT